MRGVALAGAVLVVMTLVPAGSAEPGGAPQPAALGAPSFAFGAAGDFGYTSAAQATFASAGAAGIDFFLALGDTTYGDTSEATWCGALRAQVPHVVVEAGNHDTGENTGADLAALLAACPYTLNETATGSYGHETYFDYPAGAPLARVVLTACGVSFVSEGGGTWGCAQGDSHYTFVEDAIDGARAAAIPWVIVGMHKNCISAATKSCEVGSAFFSMLLQKRVDLVLQGHEHIYERSHQLVCASPNTFVAACVGDNRTAGPYRQGAGSVVAVAGTGGKSFYTYNPNDAEAPYFAAAADATNGFLRVEVNASVLAARFVRSAGAAFNDSFAVARAPTLALTGPSDGALVTNAAVNVSGTTLPGAEVSVNGARAEVAADGSFSMPVPLWPGGNTLVVRAWYPWGASVEQTVNVTFDDPAFHLRQDLEAALADLALARAQAAAAEEQAARAEAEVANLSTLLDAATQAADAARNESVAAQSATAALAGALEAANATLEAAAQHLALVEASANATAADLEQANADLLAAEAQVADLADRLSAAEANATAAARLADAAGQGLLEVQAQLSSAQSNATRARMDAQAAQAAVAAQAAAAAEGQAAADEGRAQAATAQAVSLVAAAVAAGALVVAAIAWRRTRPPDG